MFIPGKAIQFASIGYSQISTTELSGTVYDPSGAVVTTAIATVVNTATGTALKQVTNSAILYSFPSMAVGTCTLTIEKPSFKTAESIGITLVVGTPATVNVTLDVGAASEVVKVEAAATPINTDTATLGNVVERQAVSLLPLNGRDPINPRTRRAAGTTAYAGSSKITKT